LAHFFLLKIRSQFFWYLVSGTEKGLGDGPFPA
jgi:hypothetical protein